MTEKQSVSRFRPCIDLHDGKVKQIVGGTLAASGVTTAELKTNFVAEHDAGYYAELYRTDGLLGAHVIKLGPNNDAAARQALMAWPGKLQVGGGITDANAREWIEAGAAQVIVTSWLFPNAQLAIDRVKSLSQAIGRDKLVIDLSCRRRQHPDTGAMTWFVAMDKWQTITSTEITPALLQELAQYCVEFLVHAADVEGLCQGIDEDLVRLLGASSPIPCTYAGGGKHISDLELVDRLSNGRVDLTFGSDCVAWNQRHSGH
ncbi:phosphoribosylformimino-5-aminoimidazole carboxamide ribotide isomerase [Capsaspora owczarzaki ATCC 30864]|uniref:1-(5-phosphoribosyl)-5-[(5-phosphoribosylamino)methylideneamino]imidazole-4-carboxamideisomerase n=1 Tax=Capsaspora owczarzaki (strain ATCC 30864) TaxID=595528 RepID=A0A0D2X040_CAPO3|nr:phosphoribosylformimino-5-aminoimidazole carboxamide ribotide isomerase [Capsaspora owczarzaki ATCC 30864]